jgi:hypothetical protein
MKYSEWKNLPHILCALGHHDHTLARKFIKIASVLFDSRDRNRWQHPLADLLLNPSHPKQLRVAIDRFVAGEAMPSVLKPYAGGLAGIRTAERSIEGRMSENHILLIDTPC